MIANMDITLDWLVVLYQIFIMKIKMIGHEKILSALTPTKTPRLVY